MSVPGQMLESHPKDLRGVDPPEAAGVHPRPLECAQSYTVSADACPSEDVVAELTKHVWTTVDRDPARRFLSRHTGHDANLTRAVLEACPAVCKACGDECARHAEMHGHCRTCAEACRRCELTCSECAQLTARTALGPAPRGGQEPGRLTSRRRRRSR